MNDFKRLEEKLAKLSEKERPGSAARTLTGRTGEERLSALVAEIDEVILPRVLTLTDEAGPVTAVAAGNRRLQGLVPPVPGDLTDLIGAPMPGDDETLVRVKNALVARFADAGPLTIASQRRADTAFPAESGVPVTTLSRVWGIAEADLAGTAERTGDPVAALVAFLASGADSARGWLRIDGESVVDQGGDADVIARIGANLGGLIDTFLSRRDMLGLPDDRVCALTIQAPGTDGAAVLADHGNALAVLVCDETAVGPIMSAWRSAVAA